MGIIGIDHVAIRVKDIEEGIANYRKLGYELSETFETPGIGKQEIFRFPNGSFIELVAPLDSESAVGRALENRGEGVHSLVLRTDDFENTVESMIESGVNVIQTDDLKDNAFVHPKSTNGVLLQIQKVKS